MTAFPPVAASPYLWPFDGAWSVEDTMLLSLGFQAEAVAETGGAAAIARLSPFVANWRTASGRVCHSRRGYDPASGLPPAVAARNAMRKGDRILAIGDAGWQIDYAVAPGGGEPVIDHAGDNGFLGTDLAFLLQRSGIRNLLVAGIRTEGIVHATMRAANDMGYECLLLEDATATDDSGAAATILSVTRFGNGLFGCTATIATVEAALAASYAEGGI